jgi:hypothetical protein
MRRWVALIAIAGLVFGTGLAYADTATAGTFANFSGVSWGSGLFTPDPYNDDVDNDPPNQDGRDIYTGIWWQRDATYDYFRVDLAGAPHDTLYDWANVYGVYMDGMTGGAPSTDSYVPSELAGVDWIVDWHPATADVTADSLLDPGSGGNVFHFHTWSSGTWSTTNLAATEYYVAFNDGDESSGNNTMQWRIATANLMALYDFTGASHDLASGEGTTFDLTETEQVPEPATLALMGLGLAGLAGIRQRRKED